MQNLILRQSSIFFSLLINLSTMFRITVVLFLFITFSACRSSQQIVTPKGDTKIVDAAYGTFKRNKMDVFLPAKRSAETPFVVLIHGGGWKIGDKKWNTAVQKLLLEQGIASININYRYTNDKDTHCPQLIEDVDNAINYCIKHSEEWKTRKENFVLTGHSAGAHLSLLYSYTTNKKVGAVISQAGPTNIADTAILNRVYDDKPTLAVGQDIAGAKYIKGQPLAQGYANASPINFVKNIPTLIIHGTDDEIVPYAQAVDLANVLKAKNFTYKLVTLPNARHDMNINDEKTRSLITKEVMEWIAKYGK
jgi:acetyl esterase/lipase